MEFQFPSWLFAFSLFLPLVILLILMKKKNTIRLPPGPTKLPIVGNLHKLFFAGVDHMPRVFRDLSKKHGTLMHLKLGQISHIVVSSSDLAQQFLKTHDINFTDRPHNFAANILSYNERDIVFSPYGEYWRKMRKVVTLELLSAKKVKSFDKIRREEVSKMIDILTKAATDGTPVNISQMFLTLNNNILTRSAFGKILRQPQEFLVAMRELMDTISGFNMSNFFPCLEKFIVWLSGLRKRAEETHRRMDRILNTVIDEHLDEKRNSNEAMEEGNENLLDILLRIQKQNDFDFEFTMNDLKATILAMFIGGTETSSTVLESIMSELIKNPETMKKVTSEVRKKFNIIGTKTDDHDNSFSKNMSYMQNVIKENFRLHPPAPFLAPHACRKKCQINGYDLEEKTTIIVNVWAIGRDPNKWEDPEIFRPERFIGSPIDFKGSHFDLLPFSSGKRICPGITFGMANVEFPLATILYHFNWKMPNDVPGEELDMTESVRGTLCRKHPLILIPQIPTDT